jgi:hypothetical protein
MKHLDELLRREDGGTMQSNLNSVISHTNFFVGQPEEGQSVEVSTACIYGQQSRSSVIRMHHHACVDKFDQHLFPCCSPSCCKMSCCSSVVDDWVTLSPHAATLARG